MKRFIVLVALALLMLGMNSHAYPPVSEDVHSIIIEVTSTSPFSEITLEGSYVFRIDDSPLHHIEQTTPFKIQYQTDIAYGIFRRKSGGGELRVKLLISNGSEEQTRVDGTGPVIVVGKSGDPSAKCFRHCFLSLS